MFTYEFWETFQISYSAEHLRVAAFVDRYSFARSHDTSINREKSIFFKYELCMKLTQKSKYTISIVNMTNNK